MVHPDLEVDAVVRDIQQSIRRRNEDGRGGWVGEPPVASRAILSRFLCLVEPYTGVGVHCRTPTASRRVVT